MNKLTLILIIATVGLGVIVLVSVLFNRPGSKFGKPNIPFASASPDGLNFTPVRSPYPVRSGGGFEPASYQRGENDFVKNTPILQKLPAMSSYFYIIYISEKHLEVHSKTTEKQRDYQIAKNWFKDNNINTDTILIEYK